MRRHSYKIVMSGLKEHLKKQKVSYSLLSKMIEVPETTIKKWLVAEDGSYNRISLICEAIGLPLEILLKSISEQNVLTFTMSKKQQSLFSQNQSAFNVFWLLVYERKNPDEIVTLLNITQKDLKAILYKLDKVLLIEVGKDDKIKIPKMKPIHWKFKGPFMEALMNEWSGDLIHDAQLENTYSRFILQFFQLTQSSAEEFRRDIQMLEEKYARRTILELQLQQETKLIQIRYQSATAPMSFIGKLRKIKS